MSISILTPEEPPSEILNPSPVIPDMNVLVPNFFPSVKDKVSVECVSATLPALKSIIPPAAKYKSEKPVPLLPNAKPSFAFGLRFDVVIINLAVPPAENPSWSVSGLYIPVSPSAEKEYPGAAAELVPTQICLVLP